MSHFSVAVFSKYADDVDDLLEPYCEDVNAHSPYAEFEYAETADYDEIKNANGYWRNPNAKWDWYVVGGRFGNCMKLKSGERADSALVSDVDFSVDQEAYKLAERYWEVVVEGSSLTLDEKPDDFFSIYKPQYYIDQFGTKENYAKYKAMFSTWAVITPDGEWHENGSMGWFATHNATADSRKSFLDLFEACIYEYQNFIITIVDCHI